MVSGVGPRAALEDMNIPVVHASEGVGQNMWVRLKTPVHSLTTEM